jgi:hypothetical protein
MNYKGLQGKIFLKYPGMFPYQGSHLLSVKLPLKHLYGVPLTSSMYLLKCHQPGKTLSKPLLSFLENQDLDEFTCWEWKQFLAAAVPPVLQLKYFVTITLVSLWSSSELNCGKA